MTLPQEGYLLRLFIGENDRHGMRPLYEWIVVEARARGLAGATVMRGVMGFGANSKVIHSAKIERLSEDLPMVIEIVDSRRSWNNFSPTSTRPSGGPGDDREGRGPLLSRRWP